MITSELIKRHVREPYMDEIFHIDQAQRYCRHEWFSYHPKLTTPPGLYVLSMPLTAVFGCHVQGLRYINHLLGACLYWVGACLVHGSNAGDWKQPLTAFAAGVSPVVMFFHHLYYTDSASTLVVLLSVLFANHSHHWLSALMGLFSLSIRQTNVVWVVFCLVWSLCRSLARVSHETPGCRVLMLPPYRFNEFASELLSPEMLFAAIRAHFMSLLQIALPYGLVITTFASFVVWNGGVVIGDKANHVASLHFPQLGYYLVYASALLSPLIVGSPASFFRTLKAVATNIKTASLAAGLFSMSIAMVHKFTVHHPFLLSDNRHITFYIWKKFFRAHPLLPYLYVPIYIASGWVWMTKVVRLSNRPVVLWLGYAAVVGLTLVPSPLLELRYFIPHLAFLRLCLMDIPSHRRVILEVMLALSLHLFIMYRFIYKPYLWEAHPGEVQRLMW
ncbi:glucosyltransferase, variant 4 [Entomophthora muscae]|nr:glucosyltransferase, variant 4 [Entomophthora muscae]